MKARWTTEARNDLVGIWAYIANDSLDAADRVVEQLAEAGERLVLYPEMGGRREELGANVRAIVVRNYLIFYQPRPSAIVVLRVLHGARDIEALFK